MNREDPFRLPALHSMRDCDSIAVGRADGEGSSIRQSARELRVALSDPRLSTNHFQLERTAAGWQLTDLGSTNGTLLNGVAHTSGPVEDGDLIEAGRTLFIVRCEDTPGAQALVTLEGDAELASFEPATQRALSALPQLAKSRVPLLIHGETGTGKELLARAAHRLSGRQGAFVPINCAAIPANLVESELFGHRRGAFSGATEDRVGLIQAAHKGTLFLDEIGDLPLVAQGALLRVLQEREVMPIGGTKAVPVDFRLVAATHRDVKEMTTNGQFREDLLARIAGTIVRVAPLRDRREDIGVITRALLTRLCPPDTKVDFSSGAARALFAYSWPRNVRELSSALETALAMRTGSRIELGTLPETLRAALEEAPRPALSPEDAAQRAALIAALREHNGNVSAVARAMGKARMQIQRWMKRYGLKAQG